MKAAYGDKIAAISIGPRRRISVRPLPVCFSPVGRMPAGPFGHIHGIRQPVGVSRVTVWKWIKKYGLDVKKEIHG
jgi:hypothetical protein